MKPLNVFPYDSNVNFMRLRWVSLSVATLLMVVALGAMAKLQFNNGAYLEARAFSQRSLAAGANTREALLLASQIEDKLGDKAAAARYVQSMQALQQQAPTQRGTSRP